MDSKQFPLVSREKTPFEPKDHFHDVSAHSHLPSSDVCNFDYKDSNSTDPCGEKKVWKFNSNLYKMLDLNEFKFYNKYQHFLSIENSIFINV